MSAYAELLLMLAVAGFYLQDSMLLLHYDELVFTESNRRWRASAGSAFQLDGRHLLLPNPLTPARGMFRASWLSDGAGNSTEGSAGANWPGLRHFISALAPLKATCNLLGGLQLIILPLLLWRYPHPQVLLILLALIYANVGVLVWHLWRRRRVLQLSGRAIAVMGFEAIACPPHAINLVRKLCLRRGLQGDAIVAAGQLLGREDAAEARAMIDGRIAMAIEFNGEASDCGPRLLAARQRLEEQPK